MGIIELLLISVGLAMDAFAVSVCKGLNMSKINYKNAGIIALFFGAFQGFMPLIGYFLGTRFQRYIQSIDHWIAFGLLVFIGGQMIFEVFKGEEEALDEDGDKLQLKQLVILAIATSIDALAVGITFALLDGGVGIITSVLMIGIVTFIISFMGVIIGNRFGNKYESKAQLAGGIILVLIGLKILLEHMGFIS
ncbi:MAG: manganese efflux pump [Lachnospiraceae bacterium]|nr:manganese efflux pump [Lachnospiraceae bacterium]